MSDEQKANVINPLYFKGLLLLALAVVLTLSAWLLFSIIFETKIEQVPFNCASCVPTPNRCGPNNEQGILLTGHIVATNILSIQYETPLANDPAVYHNWIGVWEGAYLNFVDTPVQRIFMDQSNRCGSYAFDSLELKTGQDYIVGYGVGDAINTAGATLFIPWNDPGFTPGKATRTVVQPIEVGSDYVVISYCTPTGNDAKANNNWIGIQHGSTFTYSNNRFKMYSINNTGNKGSMVINNFAIEPDTWYTIVYGVGSEKKNITASWTFNGNEGEGPCPNRCATRCIECEG